MSDKGAALIAGAILIVGVLWLYVAEIKPRQVEVECLRMRVSDLLEAGRLCVQAGGLDELEASLDQPKWYPTPRAN